MEAVTAAIAKQQTGTPPRRPDGRRAAAFYCFRLQAQPTYQPSHYARSAGGGLLAAAGPLAQRFVKNRFRCLNTLFAANH